MAGIGKRLLRLTFLRAAEIAQIGVYTLLSWLVIRERGATTCQLVEQQIAERRERARCHRQDSGTARSGAVRRPSHKVSQRQNLRGGHARTGVIRELLLVPGLRRQYPGHLQTRSRARRMRARTPRFPCSTVKRSMSGCTCRLVLHRGRGHTSTLAMPRRRRRSDF